jgi:hypothetical protein
MRQLRPFVFLLLLTPAISGCARSAGLFSEQNARAHVEMLAGTIGSRPIGTAANARARAYIVDQLRLYGFDVRVQDVDARRAELGRTARVSNIIGTLQGARREAIGLLAHYDSSPHAPGAADDGLGVAVSLEAARVMAARSDRPWTLLVLLTDGEESGLMGAAGLMTDREVTGRLQAYLNIESAGSSGPALLFETGPANAWLVQAWARRAPHPRGGSFGVEIYRRLPNDTDFSILKRRDIPGLNFASVGDSYVYHTARDTPDRLSPRTVRDTGENVVAILEALAKADITRRSAGEPTYFDIGGTVAVSYGAIVALLIACAALLLGAMAWVKVTAASLRIGGAGRWLLTGFWSCAASAVVIAAMIGAVWAFRAGSQVYHPWYAHPDRLMFLLLAIGVTFGWGMSRAGAWLPARAHGLRHPAVVWSLALPLWIALAAAALWLAPAAAYLWTVPLLAAGATLLLAPMTSVAAVRLASLVVLAPAAALWLRETVELFRFMVALFGRLTLVTPVFVYPVLMIGAAIMIVPPFIAAVAPVRPVPRPPLVTVLCLISVVVAAAAAYAAPAYTSQQPLRRYVRALQESGAGGAIWEVASVEPGLDLTTAAPGGWSRQSSAPVASVPWGVLPLPFVFRTTGPALGPAPLDVAGFVLEPVTGGTELTLTVVPKQAGLAIAFVLPAELTPARTSLPGAVRLGRWTATYIAPAPEGVVWKAGFTGANADRLHDVRIAVTDFGFPGGSGWQRLPAWLPQERAVWTSTATWVVPASGVGTIVAAAPSLR